MNSTWMSAKSFVYFKESLYFIHDIIESTSFISRWRFVSISMHWIANPKHFSAGLGDAINESRERFTNLAGTHTSNKCNSTWFVIRIELFNQCECIFHSRSWTKLDTDGVIYLCTEINMCAIELTCSLANPKEVRRNVIRKLGARVDASERLLVFENKGFVA